MLRDRPLQTMPAYKPGVVRRNSLSEVSLHLTESLPPTVVPSEEFQPTIERSVCDDPKGQPQSPLHRRGAQKGNSPKRIGMQIEQKHTSPSDQKSFEYTNSLPTSLNAGEVKTTPVPTRPISRSSHYQEILPSPSPSTQDARSTTLPGAAAASQPSEKSSKKRTPRRRRSRKMNKWTAKGTYVCHVCVCACACVRACMWCVGGGWGVHSCAVQDMCCYMKPRIQYVQHN